MNNIHLKQMKEIKFWLFPTIIRDQNDKGILKVPNLNIWNILRFVYLSELEFYGLVNTVRIIMSRSE